MKKHLRFLLVLMLATFCVSIEAQEFKFGPTIGLNVNVSRGSEPNGATLGYTFGGTALYNFNNSPSSWYVSGALLFSQKGYKDYTAFWPEEGKEDKKIDSRHDITSLEVPIHVGKNFAIGGNSSLFVEVGPYIACGLWGKSETKMTGKTTSSSHKVFEKNGYQRFDYGFSLGFGANISNKWRIKCNYEYGIPNLMKNISNYPGTAKSTYRNGCISTTLSYMF